MCVRLCKISHSECLPLHWVHWLHISANIEIHCPQGLTFISPQSGFNFWHNNIFIFSTSEVEMGTDEYPCWSLPNFEANIQNPTWTVEVAAVSKQESASELKSVMMFLPNFELFAYLAWVPTICKEHSKHSRWHAPTPRSSWFNINHTLNSISE